MSLAERSGKRLSELKKVMHRYPQVLINVKVKDDAKNELYLSEAVKLELDKAEQRLQGCGRILVRPSGTEPLVRVMAEGKSQALILELAERIALTVEKEFG
jgi:phosphoglucosamine mutase